MERCGRFSSGLQTQGNQPPSPVGNLLAQGRSRGKPQPDSFVLVLIASATLQDSNGRITRIFLPTHCLRSCRRPCGAGNHQSYRWWQDGPSSRSRTSRSHGSDPDLCQSSDRPDLPEKGRQFQLPGTRAAVSGEPSGSTARPLRVHCSLSAGTTDALKSPRLRQLARQGQYGGVGGTNAALLDKCRQAKHLEQGSDLAVCVAMTAICPSLARLTTNPAQDVVTETGDGKGRSRGSRYSPLS